MECWTLKALTVAAAGLLLLAFSGDACAYIDPGTGSLVLQMLIAAVVGGGFALSVFWKRVRAFFAGLFGGEKKTEDEGGDEQ